MDIRSALKSHYHAALGTLREAIERRPNSMWNEAADRFPAFWRVAYHTLFSEVGWHFGRLGCQPMMGILAYPCKKKIIPAKYPLNIFQSAAMIAHLHGRNSKKS
jgi:hypothetical protein